MLCNKVLSFYDVEHDSNVYEMYLVCKFLSKVLPQGSVLLNTYCSNVYEMYLVYKLVVSQTTLFVHYFPYFDNHVMQQGSMTMLLNTYCSKVYEIYFAYKLLVS